MHCTERVPHEPEGLETVDSLFLIDSEINHYNLTMACPLPPVSGHWCKRVGPWGPSIAGGKTGPLLSCMNKQATMCTGPGMPIRERKRSQECSHLPLNSVSLSEGEGRNTAFPPATPLTEVCMHIRSFPNSYDVHFESGTMPSILWKWTPKALSTTPSCQISGKQAGSQGESTFQCPLCMWPWRMVLSITQVFPVLKQSRPVRCLKGDRPNH